VKTVLPFSPLFYRFGERWKNGKPQSHRLEIRPDQQGLALLQASDWAQRQNQT
jgi:hypothetical protein